MLHNIELEACRWCGHGIGKGLPKCITSSWKHEIIQWSQEVYKFLMYSETVTSYENCDDRRHGVVVLLVFFSNDLDLNVVVSRSLFGVSGLKLYI